MVFKTVYDHLENEGFEVYPIGVEPNYNEPLIILKDNEPTRIAGTAFNNCIVYLYCHIPLGDYIKVLEFKEQIKLSMEKLPNFEILDVGDSPIVDQNETYLFVLQYNNKRVRRIL